MRLVTCLLLVLATAGLTGACRDNPLAPTIDGLARSSDGGQGTEVGNRVLFPQVD